MKNLACPASHPIKFPAILKIFLAFGSLHFLPVISGTRIIFRFPGKQGRCVVPLRLERVGEVIRAHPCNPWQNHLRQQNPFVSFFGKIHPALNNSKPHTTTQLSQACAQLSSPLRGGREGVCVNLWQNYLRSITHRIFPFFFVPLRVLVSSWQTISVNPYNPWQTHLRQQKSFRAVLCPFVAKFTPA